MTERNRNPLNRFTGSLVLLLVAAFAGSLVFDFPLNSDKIETNIKILGVILAFVPSIMAVDAVFGNKKQ